MSEIKTSFAKGVSGDTMDTTGMQHFISWNRLGSVLAMYELKEKEVLRGIVADERGLRLLIDYVDETPSIKPCSTKALE